MKEVYRDTALSYIPKILQLCDRNPYHDTYGCFDRSFWHYKTMDFPSGMYQEYVLPLALVYKHAFGITHPWHENERVKELCLAGIGYAARTSRKDGSCDDYYPYERALGAAAFSLYAATESLLLLENRDADFLDFCSRRGSFVADHQESGRLSNHQALAALALCNVWLLTQDDKFLQAARTRIAQLLKWQSAEGWFQEYEGCDPGYLTATISFLAQYYRKSGNSLVLEPLKKAIAFASHFLHRDCSYGGEYGSRNTYHYYPLGFELMASASSVGTVMNDLYAKGIQRGKRHDNSDDRIFGHLVYDYLQACLAWFPTRGPSDLLPLPQKYYYGKAGLLVVNTKGYQAVVSVHKGGVIKAYNNEGCFFSDLGLIGENDRGTRFVSHQYCQTNDIEFSQESFNIGAGLYIVKDKVFSPFKQIIFRLACLCVARLNSDFFRRFLQKLIIFKKKPYAGGFQRSFVFGEKGFQITDRITSAPQGRPVERLSYGSDHTSIYTAAANTYQESVLLPWIGLQDRLESLNRDRFLEVQREVRAP